MGNIKNLFYNVKAAITLWLAAFAVFVILGSANQEEIIMNQLTQHKIKITVGEKVITTTLSGSKTSRDFISLLPLTITLEDYNGTEKISYLPRKLSVEDSPKGSDPSVGDITYYAPWGNLAIFYKDFGYSSGLIILGKIDSNVEFFNVPGSLKVKIELLKKE